MRNKPYTLIYVGFLDLSKDDGKSINEREFVRELLARPDLECCYVGPKMSNGFESPGGRILAERHLGKSPISQMRYQLWLLKTLFRLYKKYGKQVILCTRPNYAAIAPMIFKRLCKAPWVVKFAGLPIPLISARSDIPIVYRKIAAKIFSLNGRSADRLWVVTEAIGDYWERHFKIDRDKMFVLPNGVNLSLFRPDSSSSLPDEIADKIPKAKYTVGYAGGLRKMLGIDFLIRAAEKLIGAGHDYAFVVAGTGEYRDALERMVREKGLQDRFVLLGHIPYRFMPSLYRHCDVLVAPFSRGYVENFGSSSQKIFQYLACGKPVVAARTQDHRFLEDKEMGKLVVSEDIDALADAIKESTSRANAGKNAYDRYDFVARHHGYGVLVDRFLRQTDRLWGESRSQG